MWTYHQHRWRRRLVCYTVCMAGAIHLRVIRIEMNMETVRSRQSSEVCGVKQKQDRSENRTVWYTANPQMTADGLDRELPR